MFLLAYLMVSSGGGVILTVMLLSVDRGRHGTLNIKIRRVQHTPVHARAVLPRRLVAVEPTAQHGRHARPVAA
ncbi:MAG: hypothetical protein JWL97_3785 [Gemmatimonadales bacterium]|nr:hypothetical protein [Gemmatimonadales bacterium]